MQWLILAVTGALGYLVFRDLSSRETGTQGQSPDVILGINSDVTAGNVGADFESFKEDSDYIKQGALTGWREGGWIGAAIGTLAGIVSGFLSGPPKAPNCKSWAIPYRPEWTTWIDDEEIARFYVPGPDEISPIEVNVPYAKLLELFPGCSLKLIKESGVVCWRPGDNRNPLSDMVYHPDVCGKWLPQWEARHFATPGNYNIAGWDAQPYPTGIRWHDAWLSWFGKQRSEKDATRAIMMARRIAYFDAVYPYTFALDLRQYSLDILRSRASWSGIHPETTSEPVSWQADGKEASHARQALNAATIYMLANSVKVRIPGLYPYDSTSDGLAKMYKKYFEPLGLDKNILNPTANNAAPIAIQKGNEHEYLFVPSYPNLSEYHAPQPKKGIPKLWGLVNG